MDSPQSTNSVSHIMTRAPGAHTLGLKFPLEKLFGYKTNIYFIVDELRFDIAKFRLLF